MTFNLELPTVNQKNRQQNLSIGEILFVLGANGTGKSSLMLHFAKQNQSVTRRIMAHRQTWMRSAAVDMTPSSKVQTEQNIKSTDTRQTSRYMDDYGEARASMTIYDLIDAHNIRARKISDLVDNDDLANAGKTAKAEEPPISVINELLHYSNIPIKISIHKNERLMASKTSKNGGSLYSAAELSDGERSALLLAGSVLTADSGTLFLIDEPERHLHRSIITPLLVKLFERRSDCGFVVSTHDHDLPLGVNDARALILRSCSFNGPDVNAWDADELAVDEKIDEALKRDLLGARRKILFVEGTESSLDKPLYSLIFPMVSVIPKGSCHDVEHAVKGGRSLEGFNWLSTFGIIDGDGYEKEVILKKRAGGIYAVPFYSIEAIYYHPKIIEKIAVQQVKVIGGNESELILKAKNKGINAIRDNTERLSKKIALKTARKRLIEQIPKDDELLSGRVIEMNNNAPEILEARKHELDEAVKDEDWEAILTKCSIRESNALNLISEALEFKNYENYQKAVLELLRNDNEVLEFVRSLFEDLYNKLYE
ncbi:MAG: AAA family ATPase [Rhodobacteraceae bacterium]|nr:AAA family ATPase [Paracoccaceae bacterium]MCY4250387.1 AAA family ATPase [Paracoccaceae bacterium]